jgi:DNA-directed RNA polymerase subunit omega
MARITVEDCVTVIKNRFELCLIASNRAKSILSGVATSIDNKEKPAVISLREIAAGLVDVDHIKKNIISSIKNRGVAQIAQVSVTSNEVEEEIGNMIIAEEGDLTEINPSNEE